jgi:hypothetical protein
MLKRLFPTKSAGQAHHSTKSAPRSSSFVVEARRALGIATYAPVKGVRRQPV